MFEGLTHHSIWLQKWSSYWQKLENICKKLTVIVHRAKRAQFCVKSLLVKMRFQNLCFGTKIKIFNFFSFLTRNESQMVKNHLVKIQWTIWTHFWPNLSIVQIFQIFYWWNSKNYFHHNLRWPLGFRILLLLALGLIILLLLALELIIFPA